MGGWGERCCAHSREVDSRQETHWATRNLKTYLQLLFSQQDSIHLKFHKVPTPPPNSATNQGPSVQTPELMGGAFHIQITTGVLVTGAGLPVERLGGPWRV